MASPKDIRKGQVILFQGSPHLVLGAEHRTQGRQAGFIQISARNLKTGASVNNKIRTTDSVNICYTETKKLEFSYIDDSGYHFMDIETFEDHSLPTEVCEQSKDFLIERNPYDILFVDGVAMGVNLPASIEVEVIEASQGVRGDTASKVQKPVTIEGGRVIQVPLFINKGDRIKVSTEGGHYISRS